MPAIAFVGSAISHGGTVIEGSPDVFANNKAVARLGDHATCTLHGAVTITTASSDVFANNKGVAKVGDQLSCGAVITDGSPDVFLEEMPLSEAPSGAHLTDEQGNILTEQTA